MLPDSIASTWARTAPNTLGKFPCVLALAMHACRVGGNRLLWATWSWRGAGAGGKSGVHALYGVKRAPLHGSTGRGLSSAAANGVGAALRELAARAEWSQEQRRVILTAAEYGRRGIPKGDLAEGQQMTHDDLFKVGTAIFNLHKDFGDDAVQAAAPFIELSSDAGNTDACYTLAQLLRMGRGVERDAVRAASLFLELAMKAHPYAQFMLGGMHYQGIGVEQNFTKAFTLYKVSAMNLVPESFAMLGTMYKEGQGVSEDLEEAIRCFRRGAELGDVQGHLALAQCYTHGTGVAQSDKEALQCYMKAAEMGSPVALYNVGVHYFSRKGGVELDFGKAAEYFSKAADLGFAPAQVNLGNMCYQGLGVEKDWERAKALYRAAQDADRNAKVLLEELQQEESKLHPPGGQDP